MHGSDIFVHSGYSNADCLISSVRRNSFVIVIMPLMLPSGDLISRLFVFNNAPAPPSPAGRNCFGHFCARTLREIILCETQTQTPPPYRVPNSGARFITRQLNSPGICQSGKRGKFVNFLAM